VVVCVSSVRFDRWAGSYDDSALQPAYRAAHEAVLRVVPLRARPVRALDIGCGTGQLLSRLAWGMPEGSLLVGVDPSWGMLRTASGRLEVARPVQAAAERLPFRDATFDVIVSTASFRHWAEPSRALEEIRRVLADDGIAVIADLVMHPHGRRWWLSGGDVRTPMATGMAAAGLDVVVAFRTDGRVPVATVEMAVGRRPARR
jgi:ubiquinone/menaquinone biosynthesis C-methylase UbiE